MTTDKLITLASRIRTAPDHDALDSIVGTVYTDPDLSRDQRADLKALIDERHGELTFGERPRTPLERDAEKRRDTALTGMGIDPRPPDRQTAVLGKMLSEGFSEGDIGAGVKAVKEKSKESLVVTDASKLYHVPPGFILIFTDPKTGRMSPYVTKDGMLWKLRDFGFRSVEVAIVPDPDHAGGFLGTATVTPNLRDQDYALLEKLAAQPEMLREIYRDLMRPTIAHSSANSGNLKEKQLPWAREMCETRAILRVARVYTGCGLSLPPLDEDALALEE